MDATEDLESVVRAADGPLLTCGEIRHRLRYHLLLGDGVLEHLGGDFRSLHCFLDEIGLHPSRRNLEHFDAEALDLQTEAFGGHGAVRETAEWLMKLQGTWESQLLHYRIPRE